MAKEKKPKGSNPTQAVVGYSRTNASVQGNSATGHSKSERSATSVRVIASNSETHREALKRLVDR